MIKNGKKSNYQLKFDTSKNNLQCFMKKKSMSITESNQLDKRRKSCKPQNRSVKKKSSQFHQQKFISSIIKHAMQDDFSDPRQLSDFLQKIHLEPDPKLQPNSHQDDLLKCFQRQPCFTPQIGFFPTIPLDKITSQKNQVQLKKQQISDEIEFGKDAQWNNFSTQIQSEVTSARSKKEEFVQQYPSILANQYYSPEKGHLMFQGSMKDQYFQNMVPFDNPLIATLSKQQQKSRKSTPIRENEQFRINLNKIENDGRTTVMIRHIPNKYTQQMLIDELNVNHKNKYNFFYLPLDSYNPCNVGYAFINFIDTKFIAKFYLEFNKKRWNKFNSEKICELAYARIQGAKALIHHFENSNVMHCRDRRYRPFISFGDNVNSRT